METNKIIAQRLMAEVIRYFLDNGIEHLQIDFTFEKKKFSVAVKGKATKAPADLKEVTLALQDGRQPELDQYYADLLGGDKKPNYYLLGAMIDRAEVTYQNNELTMRICRCNPESS